MADDLPPLWCRTSPKSGALIYPEPLGPVQACCGMTFTLTFATLEFLLAALIKISDFELYRFKNILQFFFGEA